MSFDTDRSTLPWYRAFRVARHPHIHAVLEDARTTLTTRTQESLQRDRNCADTACQRNQDINRKQRALYLYERYDEQFLDALICYDCGVFHPRLLHKTHDLTKLPVDCINSNKAKSCAHFLKHRTNTAAVVIHRIPVPWLQVHQTMRALRYGERYGIPTLTRFREKRFLCWPVSWQTDSRALLVDGRLLARIRQFSAIGHLHHRIPAWLVDEYAEFICPHTRETFLYPRHLTNEMVEACRLLCNDDSKRNGFVYKRHRCTQCPTEYVIEIIDRDEFEGAHMLVTSRSCTHGYVVCVSRYIDFGRCKSPEEPEWKALSTWPKDRPKGDWGPVKEDKFARPTIDLTHMRLISARFEQKVVGSAPPAYQAEVIGGEDKP